MVSNKIYPTRSGGTNKQAPNKGKKKKKKLSKQSRKKNR